MYTISRSHIKINVSMNVRERNVNRLPILLRVLMGDIVFIIFMLSVTLDRFTCDRRNF